MASSPVVIDPRAILKRAAGAVLTLIPQRLLARLLPVSIGFTVSAAPELSVPPASSRRVYLGPANSAGQGFAWAHAIEARLSDVGATSMIAAPRSGFAHRVDYAVPMGTYRWSKPWQREQRANVMEHYTHVLVESGKRLFGDVFPGSTAREIQELRARGLVVALVFHGSDIRDPDRHAQNSTWSPYRPGVWGMTPQLRRVTAANSRLVETSGVPVFVSTPDLLLDVPSAEWLPVVIDAAAWATPNHPLAGTGMPRVAHSPSNAVVKGSDLIDPIIRKLESEGVLEYVRVSGRTAAQMPEVYAGVDIVLDQFRIGGYGVAACEAMAAGRVVISHVSSQVREHVRSATGRDLPIVQATASELEAVLRSVLASPAQSQSIAADGVRFVEEIHTGARSSAVLRAFVDG